jgi:hypothetical protein
MNRLNRLIILPNKRKSDLENLQVCTSRRNTGRLEKMFLCSGSLYGGYYP